MPRPTRLAEPPLDPTGRTHRPVRPARPGAPYDAVLLDRDGTLNVLAPGYRTPGDFHLLPGAAEAVARLTRAGCRIVIVTNQRGLSTGALTWAQLGAVHADLVEAVRRAGGRIDDVRCCPHAEGTCACRKPAAGLLEAFYADNPALRPDRSVMVGDADSDAAAAAAAGVPFVRCPPTTGLAGVIDSLLGHEMGTIPSCS